MKYHICVCVDVCCGHSNNHISNLFTLRYQPKLNGFFAMNVAGICVFRRVYFKNLLQLVIVIFLKLRLIFARNIPDNLTLWTHIKTMNIFFRIHRMKRWRCNTLLLIAILSTCLVITSANDDDDEDDGVTIEAEKIVIFNEN